METSLNPFNITFGKEPMSLISRENDVSEIMDSFTNKQPDSQVYVLTGPRGSGKTVCLTTISNNFKKDKNWIVIELNPETEILEQLASKLYDKGRLRKLFIKPEFNFSFNGFGFSIRGEKPIANVSSLLNLELEYLKSKKVKVLITIDEISSNQYVKVFAHEFQLFIRNNYDVFLLMTGLYQNIYALQNVKTLTFLNRAPKINLSTLNMRSIANSYKRIFKIDDNGAIELAKFTKGYPFAYQLLGDLLFKNNLSTINEDLLDKFDEILQERAYTLMYDELSQRENDIVKSICKNNKNQSIIEDLQITKSQLSNYKSILINKGILEENSREILTFKLPRFKEYIEFLLKIE